MTHSKMRGVVNKFGGSPLGMLESAAPEQFAVFKNVIEAQRKQGIQSVQVLSAFKKETDRLLNCFCKLIPEFREIYDETIRDKFINLDKFHQKYPRELQSACASAILTGELFSSPVLMGYLLSKGIKAAVIQPSQIIITDDNYLNADIVDIKTDKIMTALANDIVPIVPGFQGATANGDLTVTGRNGTDYVAVALAAKLGFDAILFKDVDGVFDRDPKLGGAKLLRCVSYDFMYGLDESSTPVYNKAVKVAHEFGIDIRVCSLENYLNNPDVCTIITSKDQVAEMAKEFGGDVCQV